MSVIGNFVVIVDPAPSAALLGETLEKEGYQCRTFTSGKRAWEFIQCRTPKVVLTEHVSEDLPGERLLSLIRAHPEMQQVRVVFFTHERDETAALVRFALGADDYICKPCSIRLLLARVAALVKSNRPAEPERVLTAGPIELNYDRHEIRVLNRPIRLTPAEFSVARVLLAAKGRVLSREQILSSMNVSACDRTDRLIDVYIAALRRKFGEEAGQWIKTVRGLGFSLNPPQEDDRIVEPRADRNHLDRGTL